MVEILGGTNDGDLLEVVSNLTVIYTYAYNAPKGNVKYILLKYSQYTSEDKSINEYVKIHPRNEL